jgi:hypothetical protein
VEQDDPERKVSRFRNRAEEYRTSADGMMDSSSRAAFRRLADTYDRLAATFEAAQPPCKVKARDGTGKELEIFCETTQRALDVYADFCERGCVDVEIQDLRGNSITNSNEGG